MPTAPGAPGTCDSPGRGKVHVVGPPTNVRTIAEEPEPKSTSPVNVLLSGLVAGGRGLALITRHAEPVCWGPAVTVAVIAPESASVPFGATDPRCAPGVAAGAAPPERSTRLRPTGTAMITAATTATKELSSN